MTPGEKSEPLAPEFIYKIPAKDSNWPFSVTSTMVFSDGLGQFLPIFGLERRDSALWLIVPQKHIQWGQDNSLKSSNIIL